MGGYAVILEQVIGVKFGVKIFDNPVVREWWPASNIQPLEDIYGYLYIFSANSRLVRRKAIK